MINNPSLTWPSTFQGSGRHDTVRESRVHGQIEATVRDEREPDIDPKVHSSLRIVAFYFGIALVFVRFSLLHELLTNQLGINLYPLYVLGIPAIAGVLFTGGLKRTLRFRPAKYWVGFALWLIPSTAFSIWRGGSFEVTSDYYRTSLIMLFVIGGLTVTWHECRVLLYTIAAAASATMALVVKFGERDSGGRMHLPFGAVANSNDYACHLILLLPFVLWVSLVSKSWLFRFCTFAVFGFGIYQILSSASRGAMLGIVTGIVLYVSFATAKQRRIALVAAPVVLAATIIILPAATVKRMFTFKGDTIEDSEAADSAQVRQRLLIDSILMTVQHPLLGVGPGQFSTVEGQVAVTSTGRKLWFETHNAFTKASSETGLPGLIFFVGGIASSLILLQRMWRRCEHHRSNRDLANAMFCARISICSYCIGIFFLNFTYYFYQPAIAGLVIAFSWAERTQDTTGQVASQQNSRIAYSGTKRTRT